MIMGTCDAAREREATKELINILTTETEMNHDLVGSDEMDRSKVDDVHGSSKGESSSSSSSSNSLSVEDILKNEINEIKQQRHNGSNSSNNSIQFFTSINTGIKGIVLVRVNCKSLCPVRLLKSLFDRIRSSKLQVSRYLAKVIPLQICFFPTEVDLVSTLKLVIDKEFVDCTDKSLPCLNDFINESLKSKKRTIDQVHVDVKCSNDDDDDDIDAPKYDDHGSSGIEASTVVDNPSKEIKESSHTLTVDIVGTANDTLPSTIADLSEAVRTTKPTASVVATRAASTYLLLFKARNHNVLSKTSCLQHLRQLMPSHVKQDYIHSHVSRLFYPLSILVQLYLWVSSSILLSIITMLCCLTHRSIS